MKKIQLFLISINILSASDLYYEYNLNPYINKTNKKEKKYTKKDHYFDKKSIRFVEKYEIYIFNKKEKELKKSLDIISYRSDKWNKIAELYMKLLEKEKRRKILFEKIKKSY